MSPKFLFSITVILLIGGVLIGVSYCNLRKVQDLGAIERTIAKDFPDVEHISTDTLASLLEAEKDDLLLLVDCRNPGEYAVSRIPGAINLTDVDAVRGALEKMGPPPQKIAVYGSVGSRSSKLARALGEAGIDNAVNVRGSIFAWANENRPLETPKGEPVDVVHPFNQFWARLLNEGKQANLNSSSSHEDK